MAERPLPPIRDLSRGIATKGYKRIQKDIKGGGYWGIEVTKHRAPLLSKNIILGPRPRSTHPRKPNNTCQFGEERRINATNRTRNEKLATECDAISALALTHPSILWVSRRLKRPPTLESARGFRRQYWIRPRLQSILASPRLCPQMEQQ